jgi:hypothetical protein
LDSPATAVHTRRFSDGLRGIGLLALWLFVLGYVVLHFNQWDFRTFRYAAEARARGLDPYRLQDLSVVAGQRVPLPFLYPPGTLPLFAPLARLPIITAAALWLGFKLVLLIGLIAIWRSVFVPEINELTLLFVAVFGYDAALLWDLRAGNVTVIEQALLWSGFACYVRGRWAGFATLVACASIFKLVPIVYLGLLLAPRERARRSVPFALAGAIGFGLWLWLTTRGEDGASWVPLGNLGPARVLGPSNPCALAFIDGLGTQHPRLFRALPSFAIWLWAVYAVVLALVSFPALRRSWRAPDPSTRIAMTVMFTTLVSPRVIVYGYLALVIPTLMLVGRVVGGAWRWVLIAATCAQGVIVALGHEGPVLFARHPWLGIPGTEPISDNLPFLAALGLWMLYLWRERASASAEGQVRTISADT